MESHTIFHFTILFRVWEYHFPPLSRTKWSANHPCFQSARNAMQLTFTPISSSLDTILCNDSVISYLKTQKGFRRIFFFSIYCCFAIIINKNISIRIFSRTIWSTEAPSYIFFGIHFYGVIRIRRDQCSVFARCWVLQTVPLPQTGGRDPAMTSNLQRKRRESSKTSADTTPTYRRAPPTSISNLPTVRRDSWPGSPHDVTHGTWSTKREPRRHEIPPNPSLNPPSPLGAKKNPISPPCAEIPALCKAFLGEPFLSEGNSEARRHEILLNLSHTERNPLTPCSKKKTPLQTPHRGQKFKYCGKIF